MILTFRILESTSLGKSTGDKVLLKLSRDGLEEPNANVVIMETDDLPKSQSHYRGSEPFNINFPPNYTRRPKVLVNGAEMFLEVLKEEPHYQTTINANITGGQNFWVYGAGKKSKKMGATMVKSVQITMIVSWE